MKDLSCVEKKKKRKLGSNMIKDDEIINGRITLYRNL